MNPHQSFKNIVLIGFMGTGKTSVGRILSRRLKRAFVDIDSAIESEEKCTIKEIFASKGEAAFRELEKKMITRYAASSNLILTTGGGAVLDPDNFAALCANGRLIALTAKPETIFARVKRSKHRPLLLVKNPLAEIKRLLEIRQPFYAKAEHCLVTDGKSAQEIARQIADIVDPKPAKAKRSVS